LKLSGVNNYFENAVAAIAEMFRQTGPLQVDEEGVALRGTVIRHLIIPNETANSIEVLQAIAAGPFGEAWLSLMSQYFPAHRALDSPPYNRRLRAAEYRQVKDAALALGIENGWFQDLE
jgi:putative pyruvate formate lyase activating enzyme